MVHTTNIYPTARDHINKQTYDAMVAPSVFPIHPLIQDGTFSTPFYEPFDHRLPQKSKITIATMVEYAISQVEFTIIDDHDVVVILHQMDAYIEETWVLRGQAAVRSYLNKMLTLRERFYVLFRRVMNRHPQWKQAYIGEQDILSYMREIYQALGFIINTPDTLLAALQICPTVRAQKQLDQQVDRQAARTLGSIVDAYG